VAALLLLVVLAAASPAAAATKAKIFLTRDDRLQTVPRSVPAGVDPLTRAVTALFAGPSAAERRDGIRTAIPAGTVLREAVVANGVAYLRVSDNIAAGGSGDTIDLRLNQILHTVTSAADVGAVGILLGDEPVPAPGQDPGALISLAALQKREIIGPVPVGLAAVQRKLAQLRYLPARGAVTGRLDYRTSQALIAFQAWEGLSRTGEANLDTRRRLNVAKTPAPRVRSQGRRMEVTRAKGVLLLIERREVQRVVHVSTGAGGRTPRGNHGIYRKERMSWSRPFGVWLPFASYFRGGFAFHEYPNVPAYPASHGCIRIGYPEARTVYEFATVGTVVNVV
jgi:lipoprotein-anchoring transpeptidase ErfK/SrfK